MNKDQFTLISGFFVDVKVKLKHSFFHFLFAITVNFASFIHLLYVQVSVYYLLSFYFCMFLHMHNIVKQEGTKHKKNRP